MTIKVYADVLFFTNFMMDYILLCTTAFFAKKPYRFVRALLASVAGALFASVLFFFSLKPYFMLPLTLFVSLFMVGVAFYPKGAGQYAKLAAIFYLVSFVLGGAAFALLSFLNRNLGVNFLMRAWVIYADINVYSLLAVFAVSVVVIHASCAVIKKQRIKSRYLYTVCIEKNGVCISDVALLDTGNFLKDPISQKSVVIAQWCVVSKLFGTNDLTALVVARPTEFCYIPCRGICGTAGLFAFSPDRVTIDGSETEEDVLIGISEGAPDKDDTYHIILPNDCGATSVAERM
ncbi:MAG: sigma-E processing peptidase SpoIIGA [Clostridia bacterium]|nr:sigma-E processing peptidase SpoIIGA [Clostridia bacterium]